MHCASLQCFCGQTSKVFILLSILLSNLVFFVIFLVNSIMTVLSEPRHDFQQCGSLRSEDSYKPV